MERQQLLAAIKDRMPEKRYIHTIGVADTAMKLAARFGEDVKKAEIAGILHDVCKYANRDWMKQVIEEQQMDPTLLAYHHELWHGPVGAYVAKTEFHIEDEDVLHAIRYHTTGRAGSSNLERIIYIADLIEPNRKFPGIDELREAAEVENLHDLSLRSVRHSIAFLMKQQQAVFPDSFKFYNDLLL
ncbi:MAG: bis(5'-nucleosyl)-tetraphosphatase (symmetrical) YqeK [Kurthia gibsonii]|uniref:bis(5'-nucleosyl)-tetraphosphatase (symmetrical) n=1 Tax=Kurthia gibsonii TaxID=33946 RepID=A0ABU9LH75_9BACL|nr:MULTISPECIES: bis(5'-nucleosyl)-tetraphosphatase (symmetrical) YqeK [Kurthia]AMA62766.1 HDIG domain protein [Kurthia sp. 11kri321]RXH51259.1 HD domain-containing protein [Kurthia gibsonii]